MILVAGMDVARRSADGWSLWPFWLERLSDIKWESRYLFYALVAGLH